MKIQTQKATPWLTVLFPFIFPFQRPFSYSAVMDFRALDLENPREKLVPILEMV